MSKLQTQGRARAGRAMGLLVGCGLLLAAAGCSAQPGAALGSLELAAGRAQVQIDTPEPAPTGYRPATAPVFDMTALTVTAGRTTAGGGAALALASPSFEIAPEVGVPGTTIGVVGANWAAHDVVALRLQDPAHPATQAEFIVAQADDSGNFHVNFTLPVDPPWSTLPALLIIAVSPATGVQAGPDPFVYVSKQIQQPTALAPTAVPATATYTPYPTPTFTPYPTATFTPFPTATFTPTPTATAMPTLTPTSTLSPTPTAAPVFNSPLSSEATPNTLPATGDAALGTAVVTAGELNLREGPGFDYPVLAVLTQGAVLGVVGQDASGEWLIVTVGQGAPAWVFRSSTSFAGAAPVSAP